MARFSEIHTRKNQKAGVWYEKVWFCQKKCRIPALESLYKNFLPPFMIRVFSVSDSDSHFAEAVVTYLGRLKGEVELIRIPPEKGDDPKMIIRKETEKIRNILVKNKAKPIYLDIAAKIYSTEDLFAWIERERNAHSDPDFLLGGAYGIDINELSSSLSGSFSLSKMTFPHSLALLILLEQIYRTSQIRKNTKYHHA